MNMIKELILEGRILDGRYWIGSRLALREPSRPENRNMNGKTTVKNDKSLAGKTRRPFEISDYLLQEGLSKNK
jgi:hypothetical protein